MLVPRSRSDDARAANAGVVVSAAYLTFTRQACSTSRAEIQCSISASRHAIAPGEMRSAGGNWPLRRSRQSVAEERPSRARSSARRISLVGPDTCESSCSPMRRVEHEDDAPADRENQRATDLCSTYSSAGVRISVRICRYRSAAGLLAISAAVLITSKKSSGADVPCNSVSAAASTALNLPLRLTVI